MHISAMINAGVPVFLLFPRYRLLLKEAAWNGLDDLGLE